MTHSWYEPLWQLSSAQQHLLLDLTPRRFAPLHLGLGIFQWLPQPCGAVSWLNGGRPYLYSIFIVGQNLSRFWESRLCYNQDMGIRFVLKLVQFLPVVLNLLNFYFKWLSCVIHPGSYLVGSWVSTFLFLWAPLAKGWQAQS